MGMMLLTGDETSKEIIVIAYGMEDGLAEFYEAVGKQTDDSDVLGMITELAEIEGTHKQRLYDLYLTLDPGVTGREQFEAGIVSRMMEGGFTTEEFLRQNRDAMKTIPDLLTVAMMLEAQALDLYMRYSEKIKDPQSKAVLYDLAQEEKTHLTRLGRLMEEKT